VDLDLVLDFVLDLVLDLDFDQEPPGWFWVEDQVEV
jgi:hypothetical protein